MAPNVHAIAVMEIFGGALKTVERALDVRLARQSVLASNVANANTPGFQPLELDFAAAMATAKSSDVYMTQATGTARGSDIPVAGAGPPAAPPEHFVGPLPGAAAGLDGNAVDLDRTLVALSENGLQYGAAARVARSMLAMLRYAASDGQA